MKRTFELTESQRMAVCSLLSEHMRCPGASEVYVDCSQSPVVKTTPGDLLTIFMLAPASNSIDVQDATAGEG